MNKELKLCSFCGSAAAYVNAAGDPVGEQYDYPTYWCHCQNMACPCNRTIFTVDQWNSRPIEGAQQVELGKLLNEEVHVRELTQARAAFREVLVDLLRVIDASVYGEQGLHHRTCPAPDHGRCSCGVEASVDAARTMAAPGTGK